MSEFRITEAGLRLFRKRLLSWWLALSIIGMALVALAYFADKAGGDTSTKGLWFNLAVAVLLIGIAYFKYAKPMLDSWMTYRLRIGSGSLMVEKRGVHAQELTSFEVRHIRRTREGGYLVVPFKAADSIAIPSRMEDREQLESELAAFAPILDPPIGRRWIDREHSGLLGMVASLAFIGLFLASSRLLLLSCCAIVVISLAQPLFISSEQHGSLRMRSIGILLLLITAAVILTLWRLISLS